MNRYASIQEGVMRGVCDELIALHGKMQRGHWLIKDDLLQIEIKGKHHEWQFEKGDPTSDALVLILNHLPDMLDLLRNSRNEAQNRSGTG